MDPKLMFWCVSQCLGAFGIVSLLHWTRCKMGQIGTINAKVNATKWRRNFSLRIDLIHTNELMFWCIWDHFVIARNKVQNRPNRCNYCKCSCQEVVSEFFSTNAPDPHKWTLNSCLGAFHNVWLHLGLFHYCMELGAKRAELVQLMQKFMPRSGIGIFRDERTRSSPMDAKLMFLCVSYSLGCIWDRSITARNSVQNGANWCN
jgi:hypothetical protein